MRNKKWLMLFAMLILIPGMIILLLSATAVQKKSADKTLPTCCKGSRHCCKERKEEGGLIMESMSRQFISIPIFKY